MLGAANLHSYQLEETNSDVELDAKRSHVLSLTPPEALGAFLPVPPLEERSVLHATNAADGRGTALTQGPAARARGDSCVTALPTPPTSMVLESEKHHG